MTRSVAIAAISAISAAVPDKLVLVLVLDSARVEWDYGYEYDHEYEHEQESGGERKGGFFPARGTRVAKEALTPY